MWGIQIIRGNQGKRLPVHLINENVSKTFSNVENCKMNWIVTHWNQLKCAYMYFHLIGGVQSRAEEKGATDFIWYWQGKQNMYFFFHTAIHNPELRLAFWTGVSMLTQQHEKQTTKEIPSWIILLPVSYFNYFLLLMWGIQIIRKPEKRLHLIVKM